MSSGLASHHVLMVVDGQHRRYAMDMLYEYVKDVVQFHQHPSRNSQVFPYADKGSPITADELLAWNLVLEQLSGQNTVMVEVHLGLDPVQERQLFHDLNKLVKKVAAGLALRFDTANPINQFVNEHLIDSNLVQVSDNDVPDWHNDQGAISRKDLTAINAFLFLGRASEKKATPMDVEELKDLAIRFWAQVTQVKGIGEVGARTKTVAAQPVVLKALAKLMKQLLRMDGGRQHAVDLLNMIPKIDFSHQNVLWRYYQLKSSPEGLADLRQKFPGLESYLPSDDEGYNREIGAFDAQKGWFRFSPRTNDVVPILGDMFRWMIKAPSRNTKSEEPAGDE
jgi:predicted RNA-binding Zn ribbon-like protein